MKLSLAVFAAAAAACSAAKPQGGFEDPLMEISAKRAIQMQQEHDRLKSDGLLRTVQVNTQFGPVVGQSSGLFGDVNKFLGIPYAQPPVGDLRWKNTQPWTGQWPTGSLDATSFRAGCPNPSGQAWWDYFGGTDEDCLHLNIYAPSNATPQSQLPVMFWIHGGSYIYGSGSFVTYFGDSLVDSSDSNVIVVTINYRLGILGFLAGDLLRSESGDNSVGNYGFMDQRIAMKWVHDNIASFGGDPTKVTIFGESAGGGSVSMHLSESASWPYFSRAIIQSGSWADWTAQSYDIAQTRLPQVAANLNCNSASDVLACLRTKSYQDVLAIGDGPTVTHSFLEWSPVVDGVVITADPRDHVNAGHIAPVPILLGFNQDEGTVFNDGNTNLTVAEFPAAVSKWVGAALAPSIVARYNPAAFESPWWALTNILGDSQILCPAQFNSRTLTNPKLRPNPPAVYTYYYTHTIFAISVISDLADKPLGCFHGSDIFMVFDGIPELLIGAGESSLRQLFQRYWTRFAMHGNPNDATGQDPQWPEFRASNGQMIQLDTDPSSFSYNATVIDYAKPEYCNFWANVTIPQNQLYG